MTFGRLFGLVQGILFTMSIFGTHRKDPRGEGKGETSKLSAKASPFVKKLNVRAEPFVSRKRLASDRLEDAD